ncbi:MAG: hypothetical protein K6A41_06735 [Bacteroidales bacterium]|nr:hypothetical protein [Bacteroidales bacterium]
MNCGCEYTSFPLFQNLESYSRFDHSVGCGLMVWHFTQDPRQTVAALLHDVASPAFAHVIDFLNGDHERQESTEDTTESVIAESPELMKLLTEMNLTLEDVADYHLYPIADNDTPRLSADRLEYTLGNIVNYRIGTRDDVKRYYDNLIVGRNEEGTEELMFSDLQTALDFGMTTLRTSRIYVCDEDRYSMQTLAELLKKHIERGILNVNDLYTTEKKVIALLEKDEEAKNDWLRFRSSHKMIKDGVPAEGKIIAAKKRHINPMVSGLGRLTDLSEEFAEKMQEFMSASFDMPLWGI